MGLRCRIMASNRESCKELSANIVMLGDSRGRQCIFLELERRYGFTITISTTMIQGTVRVPDTRKIMRTVALNIWDIPGQERFHALTLKYYRNSNGAIVVYDITDEDSFNKANNWVKELHKISDSLTLCIVGNKNDLEGNRAVSARDAEEYAASVGAKHYLISAIQNDGIQNLLQDLSKRLIDKDTANPHSRPFVSQLAIDSSSTLKLLPEQNHQEDELQYKHEFEELQKRAEAVISQKNIVIDQQQEEIKQIRDDLLTAVNEKDDLIERIRLKNLSLKSIDELFQNREDILRQKDEIIEEKQHIIMDLEDQLQKRHWVLEREDVQLTDRRLGGGAFGEVRVAIFRGTRVAAKLIHEIIISNYNRGVFTREMEISAQIHHPNVVQFIGATRVDNPILLYELMDTSLHKQLETGKPLTRPQVVGIASDVCIAMCYLHQWRPQPIIHRDISSPNVLMEPLPNDKWRAKLSDFGSANLQLCISKTEYPGNAAYSAPEARHPSNHSPAMDIYSFGVLLVEMVLHRPPEVSNEDRESCARSITWLEMRGIVLPCINSDCKRRPSSIQLLTELQELNTV